MFIISYSIGSSIMNVSIIVMLIIIVVFVISIDSIIVIILLLINDRIGVCIMATGWSPWEGQPYYSMAIIRL